MPWVLVLVIVVLQLTGASLWSLYQRPDLMDRWIDNAERLLKLREDWRERDRWLGR